MPPVLTVACQKGGVGKTTTATNLAAAIVGQYNLRVLVLDLDPQCNATQLLLGHAERPPATIRDVLWEPRPAGEVMLASSQHPDLLVVPGSRMLAADEKNVTPAQWNEIAQDARQTLLGGVPPDVDLVIIDTPPSVGLWLHCGLAASDGYVLVVGADNLSATGASDFLETAERVRQHLNPDLQRFGIVVNNVRPTVEDEGWVDGYREAFGADVLAIVPQRNQIKVAQNYSTAVEFFAGAPQDARTCYREIGVAVLQRLGIEGRARAPFGPEPEEPSTAPSAPAVAPATRNARRRSAQSPASTEPVAAQAPASSPTSAGRAGQGSGESPTRPYRMRHKSSDVPRTSNDGVENHG
jgi:chromosome partitioning protein